MYGKENTIGVQIDPEEGLVSFFTGIGVFSIAKSGFWDLSGGTLFFERSLPPPPCGIVRTIRTPPTGSFWEVTIP